MPPLRLCFLCALFTSLHAELAIKVRPDVRAAVADGRPVVALESTIISHGAPDLAVLTSR